MKIRNKSIIQGLSLEVLEGKVLLIVGPTGSGKSTLIKLMSGILNATKGDLIVFGYSAKSDIKKIRPLVSCLWQENSLFPNMSITDNLKLFCSFYGRTWNEARSEAIHIMHEFGIFYEQDKFVSNLSTGSQRKVDLIRTLTNNTKLVLLDEPSSSLDNKSKKVLIRLLNEQKQRGTTIVIVSHHASLFEELIDNLVILKSGKVVYYGSVQELTASSKEFSNGIILKTSDRIKASELLRTMPKVCNTYTTQKAVHLNLIEGADIFPILDLLAKSGLVIKQILTKKPNLDKLVGEVINAN